MNSWNRYMFAKFYLIHPPFKKNIKTDYFLNIYIYYIYSNFLSFIVSWCLVWFGAPISEKTSEMLHGRTDGLQTADLDRGSFCVPIMKEKSKAFQDIPCQDIFAGYLCDLFKIWIVFGFFSEISGYLLECFGMFRQTQNGWDAVEDFKNDCDFGGMYLGMISKVLEFWHVLGTAL